jgi:hypothetical protein
MSSTPPPIPPRPVNIKMNGNRVSNDTIPKNNFQQRFPQPTSPPLLPSLHNNDVLLIPQRPSMKTQRPLSSASSSESLNDSLGKLHMHLIILYFNVL